MPSFTQNSRSLLPMRTLAKIVCVLVFMLSLVIPGRASNDSDSTKFRPFAVDEELHYKIHFGWFTIGKGWVRVKNGQQDTYKVEAEGRTVGLLGIFANLEDEFSAWIDSESLQPIEAERRIKDGRYWRHQRNKFQQDSSSVHIDIKDFKDPSKNINRTIEIPDSTLDILSSYLYLRSVDWSEKALQDSVMIGTFYGKKIYDFGVEYAGKERIKYRSNRIMTHKLYVLFPNSTVFPEDRPVTVWVTADGNQLPIKISARLGIGKATVELEEYKNLKYPRTYFRQ